ncbi:hypothetical protein LINPERPRIM_LOCUS4715 [Linum perenne]
MLFSWHLPFVSHITDGRSFVLGSGSGGGLILVPSIGSALMLGLASTSWSATIISFNISSLGPVLMMAWLGIRHSRMLGISGNAE